MRIKIVFAVIILAFFIGWVIWPATQRPIRSFAGYYAASKLLVRGQLGPQAYNNTWFNEQLDRDISDPVDEILRPSLPTVALLALPVVGLAPHLARNVWIWVNFGVLLLTLGLLLKIIEKPPLWAEPRLSWLPLGMLALLFPAVAVNFSVGQSIILFFGLFTLSLYGLKRNQPWLAGMALGLAFALKATGMAIWLLFLLHQRWRALFWGVATILIVIVGSLPWIGLDTWLAFGQVAGEVTTTNSIKAVAAYQTTAGFFTHLFYYDPQWNPAPLYHWPSLANGLTWLIMLAATAITVKVGLRASMIHLFVALVPLSVILLPVAEEHHFVVLLIPIFVLLNDLLESKILSQPSLPFWRGGRRSMIVLPPSDGKRGAGIFHGGGDWRGIFSIEWLLFGAALLLLVLPIPYENQALGAGWWALLAYPRLYGAWLLWGLTIWRMTQMREMEIRKNG